MRTLLTLCLLSGCGATATTPDADAGPLDDVAPASSATGSGAKRMGGFAGSGSMVVSIGAAGHGAGNAGALSLVGAAGAGQAAMGTGGAAAVTGTGGTVAAGMGGTGDTAGAGVAGAGGSVGTTGTGGTIATGTGGTTATGTGGATGSAGSGPCADSDGDGVCDAVDRCQGFDDALDADGDGVPDDCDRCPDRSDADADGNGYPDACDQILDWINDRVQTISTVYLPFINPRAQLMYDRGLTATAPAVVGVTLPQQLQTVSNTDARTLTLIENALKNPLTQYEFTSFVFDSNDGSHNTVKFTTTMAVTHLTAGQHITRIACTGYASATGMVATYWQIRGY